jgi:hypothetical protein
MGRILCAIANITGIRGLHEWWPTPSSPTTRAVCGRCPARRARGLEYRGTAWSGKASTLRRRR